MYKGTLAVLTQSELLEFERMLASAPEVYDYCAHMTDQQLNYLIAFLSRSRENTMIESRQVKEALDEALRASASKDETLKAQDAELEELKAALKEKDAALAKKDRVIRDKNKTLAKKDKHISDLEEQLEESKVNRYGRRRMKSKDEKASGKSGDVKDDKNKDDDSGNNGSNANPGGADRQQCEEEYDGVTPQEPVTEDRSGEGKNSSSTDCTFNPKNRPECYKTMGLREVSGVKGLEELLKNTEHKFDLSRLPAGAIVKARRYRTFYTMRTILLKETIEQLRELLSKELSRENPKRSYCMEQALNYFDHFKDDLFRYRKDGNYPIDNNLAERQVRPFTAMRKGIQHYGSDDGAERAAVYLSVVSTVKLAGVSVWKFLGYFFEDMVTGGSKHRALLKLSAA